MSRHTVCRVESVEVGKLLPVTLGRASIFVLRLPTGEIKAFFARCPHHGADLTYGCVTGRAAACATESNSQALCMQRPNEVLRCPWHGFEFDLVSGQALVQPSRLRLREYPVSIEGEDVVIEA